MSPFTALPFPAHTPGRSHQTPWEQHPLPLMTSSSPPHTPLGPSAFPRTLPVPSVGDSGPSGARPAKVIVQVRTEGRSAELPGIQTFVMGQTPLNWSAPGAPSGAVQHAPPPYGEASAVIPATSVVGTQACRGIWSPALSLQAPPPAAQLASIFPQVKACSGQHASSGEERLAATQSRPSLYDSSCNPQGVYQNYGRWQCFKSLAQRHHPQSPATEALSCFLIPVLQSLARLKPTMTLEEGLWRSVQEWQRKSNFHRMIFYEMAEKFMESEAEEELQIQMLQQRNASVCLPPPAPRNLDPHRLLSTVVGQHPAIKEYVEIMEDLLGTAHSATVEADGKYEEENEQHHEENELYPDPGLLSYMDKLCAQEAFIIKLVEKQLLELKGKVGVEAPPTYGVPTRESPCTESGTSQDLGSTDNHNIQLQMSEKMSTKKVDADDLPKDGSGYSNPSKSKELALFTWSPMSQELTSKQSASPQRGASRTSPILGNRETLMSLEASPISETPGKGQGSSEEEKEEEELPSLDFLLASQESLLPWNLSKSPLPASSTLHHGVGLPGEHPSSDLRRQTDRGESGRGVRSCAQGLRPPLAQPRPAARPTLGDPAFPGPAARLPEGDLLQLTPEAVRGRQFARPRALSQEGLRMRELLKQGGNGVP
nr:NUT family member 2G-like [Loxodonta africana]